MKLQRCSLKKALSEAGFVIMVLAVAGLVVPPGWAQSQPDELGLGSFLVASRSLRDPNFSQTVIVVVDYSEKGALGLIVNRPTDVELSEMVADLELIDESMKTVWVGGPVAHWQVVLLARSVGEIEGAERIFEDIYFTASRDVLEDFLATETEFRAYAGYAGWAAGQLESEIDRGSWHVLPGEPEMIFDPAPLDLWTELISRGEAQWASLR